ncbi:MAG: glycosyltransferase family A protein, partial [Candidatus Cloacimonetes bacterium]|nr:glycosyltransferase family A protein [Candidatus Cloacimonadota bacterium]
MINFHKIIYATLIISCFLSLSSFEIEPKVSIITSIYDGDEFIESFLQDIVQQTIFNQCELILINANSPGNEEVVIKPYLERYPNIVYKRLEQDPGLYGVWNLGIKMSHGKYLTNANLDDHLRRDTYEVFSNYLDHKQDITLVYGSYYVTNRPNESFEKNSAEIYIDIPEFSKK